MNPLKKCLRWIVDKLLTGRIAQAIDDKVSTVNTGTRVKKKRHLPLLALLMALTVLLFIPACETVPVTISYSTRVDGHQVTASYSGKEGLALAAEHLRVLTDPAK